MTRIGRVRYVHPSGELTVAGRTVRTTLNRFPTIATDEEALFFLVRIGGGGYRTSLLLPPMALRSGILDPFGTVPPGDRTGTCGGPGCAGRGPGGGRRRVPAGAGRPQLAAGDRDQRRAIAALLGAASALIVGRPSASTGRGSSALPW